MKRYLVYQAGNKDRTCQAVEFADDAYSLARQSSYAYPGMWLVWDYMSTSYIARYRGGRVV